MKRSKYLSAKVAILFGTAIVLVFFIRAGAREGVVTFLQERFEEKNIPVTEIEVIQETPLRLRVVIQSSHQGVTTDDMVTLNLVDREVFISARQEGYSVEGYTRILIDNTGKQLDYTELNADINQVSGINLSPASLSDEAVQELVAQKVYPMLEKKGVNGLNISFLISSSDSYQTLNVQMQSASLEDAEKASFFMWSFPNFSVIRDINAQGAQIVFYRAKITDENGKNLFDLTCDFQTGGCGWTQDERLPTPGGEPPLP